MDSHPLDVQPLSPVRVKGIRYANFDTPLTLDQKRRKFTLSQLFLCFILMFAAGAMVYSMTRLQLMHTETSPAWKKKPKLISVFPEFEMGRVSRDLSERPKSRSMDDPSSFNGMNNDSVCGNTVQGKIFVTDSTGAICFRRHLLPGGCCSPQYVVSKLSCDKCRVDIGCCLEFEQCVSCCLSKIKPQISGQYSHEDFDACMHTCRTSSRSIKHGNEYKRALKHCYTNEDKLSINSLNFSSSKTITSGGPGVSCETACARLSMVCIDEYLSHVNNCPTLEKNFPCRNCIPSGGYDQPAYVDSKAPDQYHPGSCVVNTEAKLFDCAGIHPFTIRLCLCLPR